MARPRDTEKTRDLARRAAAVLERDGLTISAEHLARELGIKRPTLLYRFPTHAHIVQAALGELLAEQAAYVESRVERHEHPIDRLEARLRAIHDFHAGRETRLLFLTQALAVTGGNRVTEILKDASALFEGARQDMIARVEKGIEDGIVHPCDARALVALLRAVIDGLTLQRVIAPSSVAATIDLFVDHLLLPLKRSPRSNRRRARKPRTARRSAGRARSCRAPRRWPRVGARLHR